MSASSARHVHDSADTAATNLHCHKTHNYFNHNTEQDTFVKVIIPVSALQKATGCLGRMAVNCRSFSEKRRKEKSGRKMSSGEGGSGKSVKGKGERTRPAKKLRGRVARERREGRRFRDGGVGEKREEENMNRTYVDNAVSDSLMTWWRRAWWIRLDDRSSMRSATGRRRVWRAASRAAEKARDGDGAG